MEDHSKIPVTITYEKPGTQPPLFVAGTFSDPQWEPQQMDCTTDEDGNHVFVKSVRVPPGAQIQYKIRVGDGDWWVLNEAAPTVTDDAGNRNNLLSAPAKSPELKSAPHGGDRLKPNPDPVARLQEDDRQRLSSTPIGQVADTAAEVADTAQKLDDTKPDRGKTPVVHIERSSSDGPAKSQEDELDELGEADGPPLFAHECLGEVTFPEEEPSSPRSAVEDREHSGSVEYDVDKYDLNDPTLERWPSDRKSIYEAVRKVETCRNEDQTLFLGSPVSPLMGARRTSIDEEAIDFSGPSSPVPTKKLDVSRKKSHSSVTSNKSLTSLAAIAEEGGKRHAVDESEEQDADQNDHLKPPQPMVSVPSPATKVNPELFASPISDEDEGVVLRSTRSKSKLARNLEAGPTTNSDTNQVSTPKPVTQEESDPSKQPGKMPTLETPEIKEPTSSNGKPQRPDEMDALDDSADDEEPADEPVASATPARKIQALRQNSDAQGNDGITGGKWLPVFLRVLFYDWIGGFLSRLFDTKQK